VIIPLKKAQELFGMSGRASVIIVASTDPGKIDSVVNKIRESLPNVDVFKSQEAATRLAPMLNAVTWFSNILFMITGAACFLGITNVTLTGILERTREIGILKAIGAKGTDVTRMIVYESAVLGALGGLLGVLVSSGFLVQGVLIPLTSSSAMPILIFPEVFVYGLILSVAISIVAALYPIWKAVHVRPQEVLRFG
jgi:putative ABC transport system permease protein